ncbi:hypothetical protein FYJ51_07065 [Erysipelotrichaceae bacterium Oil+RF-744-GAM-WT-6]|jgi:hypothetical protein|uniref:Uncharacterized protein n=1 Tax=Stecheria intestinalis TaxID=2606630 RepID=A0A7X2NSA9_9FIRM|nr:hypothetical protein [Stecheria intestinalis]MCI2154870.1 hypothetical protein [Solobacterium sp.]MCI6746923.1 hypothetical protein [Anaerolactibacter massiliensis]MDY3233165.1 hypothetical protein [Erysipelotrichaceae bacterium]MDY4682265.1 hypothetical protein [Lachnospiraceae bacterium]MDD5882165.1 hypothetical protein [Stecheria intestinalis]
MRYQDVVSSVCIYGLEESVKGFEGESDLPEKCDEVAERNLRLADVKAGRDSFLNGVIVQFDLTLTNKAWKDAERYHFLTFVSSQSSLHRITKFDLDSAYIEYVDPRIIEIMKEKTKAYNDLQADIQKLSKEGKDVSTLKDLANQQYLEIMYSNPDGFKMTARMTTSYRQLRTIYAQRRNHRLPEWRAFCDWIETLPSAELITDEA